MSPFWKKTLGSIAPLLGAAIGGPIAPIAMAIMGKSLSGDDKMTDKDIESRIKNPTADDIVKLKHAETELKVQMAKLEITEAEVYANDRNSARQREMTTGDSWTPRVMAGIITVGFLSVIGYMIGFPLPVQNAEVLYILLGSLGTAWIQVVSYYFGSSKGSDEKTHLMKP